MALQTFANLIMHLKKVDQLADILMYRLWVSNCGLLIGSQC